MNSLIIYRGLPGSGKSTLAKSTGVLVVEADMYFTDHKGTYKWSASKISQAHAWCFKTVCNALTAGVDVAVSNTFTRISEMKQYIDFCNENNIPFQVIRCVANFGNTHSVPEESLRKMRDRFEDYEGEILRLSYYLRLLKYK